MLWIVDGGMINLPVVARVEDFKEDSYIEITGATENHEWKSEPTRYEKVVLCADCKWCRWIYRKEKSLDTLVCDRFDRDVKYDWFCADGELKGAER